MSVTGLEVIPGALTEVGGVVNTGLEVAEAPYNTAVIEKLVAVVAAEKET